MSMPARGAKTAVDIIAQKAGSSAAETRARVLTLYRAFIKSAPQLTDQYALDIPVSDVRAKIREEFKKNAHIKDCRVADMLVVKGKMEYDECLHFWKQKSHVMRYWKEDANNPLKMDFLEKFFHGVD
eukprot:CFRG5248T1